MDLNWSVLYTGVWRGLYFALKCCLFTVLHLYKQVQIESDIMTDVKAPIGIFQSLGFGVLDKLFLDKYSAVFLF